MVCQVIDNPRLQDPKTRIFFAVLAGIFWCAWLALVVPLTALARGEADEILLLNLALVATLGVLLVVGWSLAKMLMARRRGERQESSVSAEATAAAYHVHVEMLHRMRSARRLLLNFSQDGTLTSVRSWEEGSEEPPKGSRRRGHSLPVPLPEEVDPLPDRHLGVIAQKSRRPRDVGVGVLDVGREHGL